MHLVEFKWTKPTVCIPICLIPPSGSSPSMWDIFAEPICPGVYFAGEHTSFVDHGTVHGAYVSGLRAASQIMGDLCEQKRLEQEERERKQREAEMAKKEKETSGTGTIERSGDTFEEKDLKDEL